MDKLIKTSDSLNLIASDSSITAKPLSFICSPHGSQHIRSEIKSFALDRVSPYISDLGDLATKDIDIISQSLIEYAEAHLPLIMFMPLGSIPFLPADFWSSFGRPVHVSSRVLSDYPDVAHLAIQRHYQEESWPYDSHKHLRLSTIRQNPEQAEVILRTADCVVIKLDALRLADNLGSTTSGSAGLTIEELCMIAKYAGASTKLKLILIEGYDQNTDTYTRLAKNAALITYYALDGYAIRVRELNQKEQLQRYSVIPQHTSQELVFIEDQRSSRWWIELYSDAAQEVVNMPCTKKDYEDACQNIISDRLTTLITST